MDNADLKHTSAAWPAASSRAAGFAVLFIAAIVRGVVLFVMFDQLEADPDAYRQIANNLLRHGSFALDLPPAEAGQHSPQPGYKPTAYRPPLYPCLLALVNLDLGHVSPLRVAVLHWLLGVATAALTFVLGRRLDLGWGAIAAALYVAFDPILLNQSTLVMTETLAAFLAVCALLAWLRFVSQPSVTTAALVGAAIGLAALCRPTFLPWLAMLLVVVILLQNRAAAASSAFQLRARHALVIACAASFVLLPWIARNYLVFARPIVTTTHGGYTLLLGNNPAYYQYLQSGDHSFPWPADDPAFQRMLPQPPPPTGSELQYDAATKQLALETIQANPLTFLGTSAHRVVQLWNPLPNRTAQGKSLARQLLRYATCAWYLVIYALAILGIAKLRGRLLHPFWLGSLLLCLSFTLMHSVYWSNLRMRAPLMPVVALLAGAGTASLAGRQKWPDTDAKR